jgi:hypothetical protein
LRQNLDGDAEVEKTNRTADVPGTEPCINAIEEEEEEVSLSRLSKIAVMVKSLVYLIIRDSQAHKFSK